MLYTAVSSGRVIWLNNSRIVVLIFSIFSANIQYNSTGTFMYPSALGKCWVLLGNSPVEELFVSAEPNKWFNKQIIICCRLLLSTNKWHLQSCCIVGCDYLRRSACGLVPTTESQPCWYSVQQHSLKCLLCVSWFAVQLTGPSGDNKDILDPWFCAFTEVAEIHAIVRTHLVFTQQLHCVSLFRFPGVCVWCVCDVCVLPNI